MNKIRVARSQSRTPRVLIIVTYVPASPGTSDGDKRPMHRQREFVRRRKAGKEVAFTRGQCSELIFVTVHPESLSDTDHLVRMVASGREIVTSMLVYVHASARARLFSSLLYCYLFFSLHSTFLYISLSFSLMVSPVDLGIVNHTTAERMQSDMARLRPIRE